MSRTVLLSLVVVSACASHLRYQSSAPAAGPTPAELSAPADRGDSVTVALGEGKPTGPGQAGPSHATAKAQSPAPVPVGDAASDRHSANVLLATLETGRVVSLADVVGEAWSRSPDVLVAESRLAQRAGETAAIDGALWPELALQASAGYVDGLELSNFGATQSVTFARFEPAVALRYRLNIGERVVAAQAARRRQDASAADVAEARRQAVRSAALAYHDIAAQRAALDISEQLIADADAFLRIATARAQTGVSSEADVALAQAELAEARRARIDAQANWKVASVTLATLLAWDPVVVLSPVERTVTTTPNLRTDDAAALSEVAFGGRGDVQADVARLQAAQRHRAGARWDVFGPDLAVELRERLLATDADPIGNTTLMFASVGWVFRVGDIGRLKAARAQVRERELLLARRRHIVRGEIATALARIDGFEQAIHEAKHAMEASERSHRIQLARFEAGAALGVEVIAAQNAAARARLQLVDTVLRFNAQHVDLLALTGHLGG